MGDGSDPARNRSRIRVGASSSIESASGPTRSPTTRPCGSNPGRIGRPSRLRARGRRQYAGPHLRTDRAPPCTRYRRHALAGSAARLEEPAKALDAGEGPRDCALSLHRRQSHATSCSKRSTAASQNPQQARYWCLMESKMKFSRKQIIENHNQLEEMTGSYRRYGYDSRKAARLVLNRAGPLSGRVLEIGTAKGRFLVQLASKAARVDGRFSNPDSSGTEVRQARCRPRRSVAQDTFRCR